MKKFLSLLLALICLAGLVACQKSPAVEEPKDEPAVVGGWETVEEDLTEETRGYFDAALEGLTGVGYTPLKVVGKQVVAGMNYKYLCDATVIYPGAETVKKLVTVYVDLEGNATLCEIVDPDAE